MFTSKSMECDQVAGETERGDWLRRRSISLLKAKRGLWIWIVKMEFIGREEEVGGGSEALDGRRGEKRA